MRDILRVKTLNIPDDHLFLWRNVASRLQYIVGGMSSHVHWCSRPWKDKTASV